MSETALFVAQRLAATRDVENQITGWKWEESIHAAPAGTVDFAAMYTGLLAAEATAAETDAALLAIRGTFDATIANLKKSTQTFVALSKNRHRNDPHLLTLLNGLKTSGASRAEVLEQSLDAEKAWDLVDPFYNPNGQQTLVQFQTLRAAAVSQQATHSAAKVGNKQALELLKSHTAKANQDCIAWYKAATRVHAVSDEHVVFDEGRLEDGRRAGIERGAGPRDAFRIVVREVDQHAAGKELAGLDPDFSALVEDVLEAGAGLQFLGIGLVDFPPQVLGTLPARHEAGFRQARALFGGRHACIVRGGCVSRQSARACPASDRSSSPATVRITLHPCAPFAFTPPAARTP